MAARSKTKQADEIAAIEDLMGDLEKRLRRLGGSAHREANGATGDVSAFVSDALDGIMKRVREGSDSAAGRVGDEAARFGNEAVKRVISEIEERPVVMLAVAAGVGYLLGMTRR